MPRHRHAGLLKPVGRMDFSPRRREEPPRHTAVRGLLRFLRPGLPWFSRPAVRYARADDRSGSRSSPPESAFGAFGPLVPAGPCLCFRIARVHRVDHRARTFVRAPPRFFPTGKTPDIEGNAIGRKADRRGATRAAVIAPVIAFLSRNNSSHTLGISPTLHALSSTGQL